jgi:hypothetical protein
MLQITGTLAVLTDTSAKWTRDSFLHLAKLGTDLPTDIVGASAVYHVRRDDPIIPRLGF